MIAGKVSRKTSKGSSVKVEFRRDLGLLDITMLGIGAMIGAGIFVLIGIASGFAGPACIIAFLLNGIVNTITAMTYAELGSAFPEAGGGYLWVKKGLPAPFGFISGWTSWFGHTVACSLYALGFGTYLAWLLAEFHMDPIPAGFFLGSNKVFAILVAAILLYINYRGTAATGKSENFLTGTKLVILMVFVAMGLFAMAHNPKALDNLFSDFFPGGGGGILFAMGLTLIAFQGYEVIAQTGEEVREPKKNIPRAIFISLFVVVSIYIVMVVVLFGMVTGPLMTEAGTSSAQEYLTKAGESGEMALVIIARGVFGPFGMALIVLGGFLSTLSALNATIFSSSRVAFAMGRDGTLPRKLGRLHGKRRTPHYAILFSGLILVMMVVFFPLKTVAGSADVMFLILFAITNAAGIALRYKMPGLDRGFKVPLFPVLPILGVVFNLFIIYPIFLIEPVAFYIGVLWILVGGFIYFFTGGAEKEIVEAPVSMEEMAGVPEKARKKGYQVLVPLRNPKQRRFIEFGSVVAKARDGDLLLVQVVEVPRNVPTKAVGFSEVREHIGEMEKAEDYAKGMDIPVDTKILLSHDVAPTIMEVAEREKVDLIVIGWGGRKRIGAVMGTNIDKLVSGSNTNVAVLKMLPRREPVDRIYILSGSGPHVMGATELAAIYAKHLGKGVTLLVPSEVAGGRRMEGDRDSTKTLKDLLEKAGVKVDVKEVEGTDIERGIERIARKGDFLFLGAAGPEGVGQSLFGNLPDRIAARSQCRVLIMKARSVEKVPDGVDRIE